MSTNNTNRGRGSYRGNQNSRGSSRNRSRPVRRRSYEQIEQESQQQLAIKKEQVESVQQRPSPPVDQDKKSSLIQKGSQWFNKFFAGIKRKDRGNLKVEFNADIDLELMDCYNYKLSNLAFTKNYYQAFHVQICGDFFRCYVNALLGIKLLKASTDSNKAVMKEFLPLTFMDLKVPKNLGVIINSIGKTDIGNDNVARILGSNSIAKQCFFKAVIACASFDKNSLFNNMLFQDGITYDNVVAFFNDHMKMNSTIRIYTKDRAGLELIHNNGKRALDLINKLDLQAKIKVDSVTTEINFRVPYIDVKHVDNIDKLLEWEQKVRILFNTLKIKNDDYITILGYAFLGWMPLKFIVNDKKTFGELDSSFQGTIFAGTTPSAVLSKQGWYSMDTFMDDSQLYNNIITTLDYYKSSIEPIYDDIFNMTKFEPTEFGNGSQTVQLRSSSKSYLNYGKHDFRIDVADNAIPSQCYTKMPEEEAIIGSVFTFNLNVSLDSSYDIHTIGTAKEIRLAYLGHDFK